MSHLFAPLFCSFCLVLFYPSPDILLVCHSDRCNSIFYEWFFVCEFGAMYFTLIAKIKRLLSHDSPLSDPTTLVSHRDALFMCLHHLLFSSSYIHIEKPLACTHSWTCVRAPDDRIFSSNIRLEFSIRSLCFHTFRLCLLCVSFVFISKVMEMI